MILPRSMTNLALLLTLCTFAPLGYAQDSEDEYVDELADFYGDEDFVSIATGEKQLIRKAPSTASVITAEDIERMGALDLDEVLESVPGLHVSYRPGNHLPIYTFRGIYSVFNPQVLMLINGVPITNIFIGNRNQIWGGMTLESVARVEVIRGPGSALYGADASSGVINVVTKNFENSKGTNFGVRTGTFSTKDFWINHSWVAGKLKGFVGYERHQTDGFKQFVEVDAQTFLDSVFGTSASLAPGFADHRRKNDEFRLSIEYASWKVNAGYQNRRIGVGLGIGEALGPGTAESSVRWNFDITNINHELLQDWIITSKFSSFNTTQEIDTNLVIFPPGTDIGFGAPFPEGVIGNPEVFERHYRTSVIARYEANSAHSFTIGVGYDVSDLYKVQESKNFAFGPNGEFLVPGSPVVDVTDSPFVFLPEDDRTNKYVLVQDVWKLANDWELTAGVRSDNYSDFGTTTNPRLALVWSSTLNLTTKLLLGRAFRAPSFAETRNINNPIALGNPNLDPETIDSYELSFNYQTQNDFKYVLSFFSYKWMDIIKFTPDEGTTTKTAKNLGEQTGYGWEFEVDWGLTKNLNFTGNYSWLSAENQANENVNSVPEHQLYASLYWQIADQWSANIKSNWVMDRQRATDDLREPLDDYAVTDVSIQWAPSESDWKISLISKNIFDSDAREPTANKGPVVNLPNDLPLPGRAVLIQLNYSFR